LRPLVIARKISFGSQSAQGALTCETLMSVLHTFRKRTKDLFGAFKRGLDAMAKDETRDPYQLLFDLLISAENPPSLRHYLRSDFMIDTRGSQLVYSRSP